MAARAEFEVLARNPDEVAISGIDAGVTVALIDDPESSRTQAAPEAKK